MWFCLAEDKIVLSSTLWQYGFPSSVLGHFSLLGANLGLGIEWAEACITFWPHNNPLKSCCPDFDVLGPTSWPVESCFLMGARVSSTIHGTFLAFWRTRRTVINASSLGITRIVSEYGRHIQQRFYETARIWRLRAPLRMGWNSFCLTFFLWTLCAVSFPRFCLLYKAFWEDYPPHLLALKPCGSSKFLFIFLEQRTKKKGCRLNHGHCSWGKESRG